VRAEGRGVLGGRGRISLIRGRFARTGAAHLRKIWSKLAPSAKWARFACSQSPKACSMVKRSIRGNCFATSPGRRPNPPAGSGAGR
jgi:hypothetical protein